MRDAAAGDRYQDAFPDVGAEEGGCDVRVLEGEEGRGEGVEGRSLRWLLLLGCGCEAVDRGGGGSKVDKLRVQYVSLRG